MRLATIMGDARPARAGRHHATQAYGQTLPSQSRPGYGDWAMAQKKKRLVFDIETQPFSELFRDAKTDGDRRLHAPKLRVACVYDEAANAYQYYTVRNAQKLVEDLLSADEVISFNGKQFDLLVLQRHYGLRPDQVVPSRGKHVDIHEVMTAEAGFRVSLHKAVQANFGERKHTTGRAMTELSLEQLKEACRSDVSQTYRLWQAHVRKKLCMPSRGTGRFVAGFEDDAGVGPGAHMPAMCPECRDVGCLVFEEADTDDMTEGQFADYAAGVWGFAVCETCGNAIFWQM